MSKRSDRIRRYQQIKVIDPKVVRRETRMWVDHLTAALSQAKGWGDRGEAIRIRIRRAIDSNELGKLKQAAAAFEAFRQSQKPAVNTAPSSVSEPPPGCGARPEENWGPATRSIFISGGQVESKRQRH